MWEEKEGYCLVTFSNTENRIGLSIIELKRITCFEARVQTSFKHMLIGQTPYITNNESSPEEYGIINRAFRFITCVLFRGI